MTNLDRFGGSVALDAEHQARADAYDDLRKNSTCADCFFCSVPDDSWWKNPENMGFCQHDLEFVDLTETVYEIGCEDFEK